LFQILIAATIMELFQPAVVVVDQITLAN
jgi:hypothetical protein